MTEKIDRTKPTCSNVAKLGSSAGANYTGGWANQSVYVGANCSDAVGKCTESSKGLTVSTDGIYSYQWNFKDQAGNEGVCSELYVKIDKTPPICSNDVRIGSSYGTYYGGGWTNQDVYTTAYCSDGSSGCSSTRKITTSGATSNVSKQDRTNNPSWSVQASGVSYTTWYVYDQAGNVGVCPTTTEYVDKIPPTVVFDQDFTKTIQNKEDKGVSVKVNLYGTCGFGCSQTFGQINSAYLQSKKYICFNNVKKYDNNHYCINKEYTCGGYVLTKTDNLSGIVSDEVALVNHGGTSQIINVENKPTGLYPIDNYIYTLTDDAGNTTKFHLSVMSTHHLRHTKSDAKEGVNITDFTSVYKNCTANGWSK